MKSLFIALVLCCLASNMVGGSFELKSVDHQITNQLYNGKWRLSDSLINIELEKAPNNMKYHFFRVFNLFYSRIFSTDAPSREIIIQLVKDYTWKAISIGDKQDATIENKFYLGCLYGFLCRVNSMQQQYWLTYWNARKCRDYLEEVIKMDPSVEDAYLGLAIIEYYPAVANIPWYAKTLAWCAGMAGDKAQGLSYFRRVAEKGVLFQGEALFALTVAYRFGENDIENSLKCWEELTVKYPHNIIFENGKKRTKISSLILSQGAKFLERDSSKLKNEYALTTAAVLNSVGYELMNINRYEDAFIVFNVNIKLFPDVANCYDSMAEWYSNKKDKDNSRKYYLIAKEKLARDTTVTSQFKEFLYQNIEQKLSDLNVK